MRTRLLALLALLLLPAPVVAATVNDNLVRAGQTIVIEEDVEGDVIAFGQRVEVRGRVNGDVIAAANDVWIVGAVTGSVRVAASSLDISGDVGRNVTAAATTVRVGDDAHVNGTVALAARSVTLAGMIDRHVDLYTNTADVRGRIDGTLRIRVPGDVDPGTINIGSSAVLNGGFALVGPHPAVIVEGASIRGEPSYTDAQPIAPWDGLKAYGVLTRLFALLVLGFVLLTIARRFFTDVAAEMVRSPGWSVLFGAVALVATPILAFILLLTMVGASLAAFVGAVLLLAWLVSGVAIGLTVGRWIAAGAARIGLPAFARFSVPVTFGLGAIVTTLVLDLLAGNLGWSSVPALTFFGGLIRAFFAALALGAILRIFTARLREREQQ